MNLALTEQIVRHVLANLGAIPSNHVNLEKSQSLTSKDFLLADKLVFQDPDGKVVKSNVYGCQLLVDKSEIIMLLANCSPEQEYPEFVFLMQLVGTPAYCLHMVYSDHLPKEQQVDNEVMMAVNLNEKGWMECGTYLQATFLAGMEQMRDIGLSWHKCSEYKDQFALLQSFLKFYSNIHGEDSNEGQEI